MICTYCRRDTGTTHYTCNPCNRLKLKIRRAKDPEARRAKQRAYYAKNRESILARMKVYRGMKEDA